jgi:peptidyl-prolyl cis-trans isomerase A (cyclophilin A)
MQRARGGSAPTQIHPKWRAAAMIQGKTTTYRSLAYLALVGIAVLTVSGASAADEKDYPKVVIETSKGKITVELNAAKAPITVENFLKYVDKGYYNGTIFHRVIPEFMVQGGGFTEQMVEKPTEAPIKLEVGKGLSNVRGTIAMARTGVRDSATSQFFINLFDRNKNLDDAGGGYAVFGKVTEGMDVVDKIAGVKTTTKGPHENVPADPVTIISVTRVKK